MENIGHVQQVSNKLSIFCSDVLHSRLWNINTAWLAAHQHEPLPWLPCIVDSPNWPTNSVFLNLFSCLLTYFLTYCKRAEICNKTKWNLCRIAVSVYFYCICADCLRLVMLWTGSTLYSFMTAYIK